MIFIYDKALRLQLAVERFDQHLVNVGLVIRPLMGQEIVLADCVMLVASEIVRLVVLRLYFLREDGCRGEQERDPAKCPILKSCSHCAVFPVRGPIRLVTKQLPRSESASPAVE